MACAVNDLGGKKKIRFKASRARTVRQRIGYRGQARARESRSATTKAPGTVRPTRRSGFPPNHFAD